MTRPMKAGIWIASVFAFLTSGLIASIAWFESGKNQIDMDITGSVVEEYFHCGSGTAQDPFVITRPVHFYHLVEFFQRETILPADDLMVEFGTDYLYFQVGYDLDNDGDLEVYEYDDLGTYQGTENEPSYSTVLNMAYYSGANAMMPIGTNEVPFIGSFDGGKTSDGGITIANLSIHCAETVLINGTTVPRATNDIGVFGYVADADGEGNSTVIKNAYFENLTIDLTDADTVGGPSVTSVSHAEPHDGEAYVGYIVGHVHGYENYDATGPTNASPLHNVYVNRAKIQGGARVSSNYGYIGKVDTSGVDAASSVSNEVNSLHGGGGHGSNWGGSIAISDLNAGLYKLFRDSSNYTSYRGGGSSTAIRWAKHIGAKTTISIGRGGNDIPTYYANNPDSNQIIYLLLGDGTHKHRASATNYTADLPGTWIPLSFDDSLEPRDDNTGYIVSETGLTKVDDEDVKNITGNIRPASYKIGHIANAYSDSAVSDATAVSSSAAYVANKTEILTNAQAERSGTNTSDFCLISDSYNSGHTIPNTSALSAYASSKKTWKQLDLDQYDGDAGVRNTLHSKLLGSSYVHGIHFMDASIENTTDGKLTIPQAIINEQPLSNYQVLKNSINFTLKEPGYIKCFAGSYYDHGVTNVGTVSSADSFFSLHRVTRSGSTISSASEIKKIYTSSSSSGDPYVFAYNNSVPSGADECVFDMSFLTGTPPINNTLYYFQIPVNAGDYALGSVSGKTGGAYLLYLDIGTSGEEESSGNQNGFIKDSSLFTQIGFTTGGFVTNSVFNIAFAVPNGANKNTFSVMVSVTTGVSYNSKTYTSFDIEIINTSNNTLTLYALLMDNDSNPNNDYLYMYSIKYNTGAAQHYTGSDSYTGASGASSMTPAHPAQNS